MQFRYTRAAFTQGSDGTREQELRLLLEYKARKHDESTMMEGNSVEATAVEATAADAITASELIGARILRVKIPSSKDCLSAVTRCLLNLVFAAFAVQHSAKMQPMLAHTPLMPLTPRRHPRCHLLPSVAGPRPQSASPSVACNPGHCTSPVHCTPRSLTASSFT